MRRSTSANAFERKVPKSVRYAHILPVVDSGASVTKYMEMIDRMRQNYKFRKDEIFKRIRLSAFVMLVVEVWRTQLQMSDFENETERHHDVSPNAVDLNLGRHRPKTAASSRSTLQSVVNGVGELDKSEADGLCTPLTFPEEPIPALANPYLLLDVRESDQYDKCHIITALNYPSTMMSRTINAETKELRSHKNEAGKIIILYDEDESLVGRVATTLVQRGYDNIFILSGGLNLAVETFPRGLVTGDASTIRQQLIVSGRATNRSKHVPSMPASTDTVFTTDNLALLENQLETLVISTNVPGYVASRFTPRSGDTFRISSAPRARGTVTTGGKVRAWR